MKLGTPKPITRERAEAVLGICKTYQASHHYFPSMREIAYRLGVSTSEVHYWLLILVDEGTVGREVSSHPDAPEKGKKHRYFLIPQ